MQNLSPLQRVRQAYTEYLALSADDIPIADVLLSTYISNIVPIFPERQWLYDIGAPGTSKTEGLRPFYSYPKTKGVSSITENGLLSGYSGDANDDPSLIRDLDGKVLMIKDMSGIMCDNKNKQIKIQGDLRDAFDGECSKSSGQAGLRSYKARFGVIAATTNAIDVFNEENQQLGERFLSFRHYRQYHAPEAVFLFYDHVFEKSKTKDIWRAKFQETIHTAINEVYNKLIANPQLPVVPGPLLEQVKIMAYILSQFRTTPIHGVPVDAEVGTRVLQQLMDEAMSRCVCDNRMVVDESDIAIVRRIVIDTLPIVRRRILMSLYGKGTESPVLSTKTIEKISRATSSVLPTMHQYHYLQLVQEINNQQEVSYKLNANIRALIDKAGLMAPGIHLPTLLINPVKGV